MDSTGGAINWASMEEGGGGEGGGGGGLQVHGIRSCRLMDFLNKEIVKTLSNYEQSNFW